jgi:hypothetical protein
MRQNQQKGCQKRQNCTPLLRRRPHFVLSDSRNCGFALSLSLFLCCGDDDDPDLDDTRSKLKADPIDPMMMMDDG